VIAQLRLVAGPAGAWGLVSLKLALGLPGLVADAPPGLVAGGWRVRHPRLVP